MDLRVAGIRVYYWFLNIGIMYRPFGANCKLGINLKSMQLADCIDVCYRATSVSHSGLCKRPVSILRWFKIGIAPIWF